MGVFGFPLNFQGDTSFNTSGETSAVEYKLCRSTVRNMGFEASLPFPFPDGNILLVCPGPEYDVDELWSCIDRVCVDGRAGRLWSVWAEKLVISLFKRLRGDSMEAVQNGSSV